MKNASFHLHHYRKLANMTQAEVAARLGVTPNTISNYEQGHTEPTMDVVIKLAHILGITTDQLLGYKLPRR